MGRKFVGGEIFIEPFNKDRFRPLVMSNMTDTVVVVVGVCLSVSVISFVHYWEIYCKPEAVENIRPLKYFYGV
jgi:hypothetical protein